MNNPHPAWNDLGPPEVGWKVDGACDRFEAAWKQAAAGAPRPTLEEFLATASADERDLFLRELLGLEVDYRQRAGESPCPEDYLARFPGRVAVLHAVFRQVEPAGPSPPADELSSDTLPLGPPPATGWPRITGYRLLELLGQGGMGTVYRAEDPVLRRPVAIKVIRADRAGDGQLRERFLREARAAAALDHDHIVAVWQVGEEAGVPFLVMPLLKGESLATRLRREPQPPLAVVLQIAREVASGLAAAHAAGLVHRDLKPDNIWLEERSGEPGTAAPGFRVKILDFGLAVIDGEAGLLSRVGGLLGTPAYMAPEQARGEPADRRSDLFSLGSVLYELLTGQRAYTGANVLAVLAAVQNHQPAAPRELRPDLPGDLEAVVLRCLEKEPARRYAGADELTEDLRRFAGGEPLSARPPGPARPPSRWPKNRSFIVGLILLTALSGGGLLGGLALRPREPVPTPEPRGNGEPASARAENERPRLRRLYVDGFRLARDLVGRGQLKDALALLNQLRTTPGMDDVCGFEWHYLRRRCRAVFQEVKSPRAVFAAAVSPDGKVLATGSDDAVRLWDLPGGRLRQTLTDPSLPVLAVAFAPDGRTLAAAGGDRGSAGELVLWDWPSAQFRERVPAVKPNVAIAFSPDSQVLAVSSIRPSDPHWVQLWGCAAGKPVQHLRDLNLGISEPWALAFAPDGQTLGVGCVTGIVFCFDLATGEERFRDQDYELVHAVAFAPDGSTLAAAGRHRSVVLWDPSTGQKLRYCSENVGDTWSVAFAPHGRTLAGGIENGTVKVWDAATGLERAAFQSHTHRVRAVVFTPDGRTLISASENGELRFADADGLRYHPLDGHAGEAWCVAFSPDGRTLLSAGDDHVAKLWDPAAGRFQKDLKMHSALVSCAVYSPDGQTIATGSYDDTVMLWWSDGAFRVPLRGHTAAVRCLAISPDGTRLASGSRDTTIRLWDVATGRPLDTLTGHNAQLRTLAFAPDGRTLFSGSEDETVRSWDVASGKERDRVTTAGEVWSLAASADGRMLAWGTKSGQVGVWELPSDTRRAFPEVYPAGVLSLAFSPDGRTLASGGEDHCIRLWQPASGEHLLQLDGHQAKVHSVAFSPDGRTLASACHDGAVWLWRGE